MDLEKTKTTLKTLIVEALKLDDVKPEEIRDDQALLDGALEIDSIDILKLILEIEKAFDIKLVQGEFDRSDWESVNALAAAVERARQETGTSQV